MSISAAVMQALIDAGATPQMLVRAAEAEEQRQDEREERKRELNRDRQARLRQRRKEERDGVTRVTRDTRDNSDTRDERAALKDEFSRIFWPAYPHKVGKPDAERKFVAARKQASLDEIMAGLGRYKQSKPAERPWCNPSTWLNQERWADRPDNSPVSPNRPQKRSLLDALDDMSSNQSENDHGNVYDLSDAEYRRESAGNRFDAGDHRGNQARVARLAGGLPRA